MNIDLRRITASVMAGVLALGVSSFRGQRDPPNASEVCLHFIGHTKWIDPRTGMADGRRAVKFSITNHSEAPLQLAAMPTTDSEVLTLNSVGFGLKPRSGEQITVPAPASAIPWRVIIHCREATCFDPDHNAWEQVSDWLQFMLSGNHYFFAKRGGTNFTLVSGMFEVSNPSSALDGVCSPQKPPHPALSPKGERVLQ